MILRTIAKLFAMDDSTWARHANPWSFWTRVPVLPLAMVAVWSRVWIGWWSLAPISALMIWTWINPRAFPKPSSTDNWASKSVLGERVWLNRGNVPVPVRHGIAPTILSAIAGCGVPFIVWGLVAQAIWPAVFGVAVAYFGKMWFVDRMVWLYEDMKDACPEYRSWLY